MPEQKESQLEYIFNHVFLPPQLPQHDDDTDYGNSKALVTYLKESMKLFRSNAPAAEQLTWASSIDMLHNIEQLRSASGVLQTERLKFALQKMKVGEVLGLFVRAQNAGLIIRKNETESSFETFEVSSTSESVIGTTGRLRRRFPGPAIAIDGTKIQDPDFLDPLARMLERLDIETRQDAIPVTTKANSNVPEARDTVSPKYITELLTGIMRAVGKPANVQRISKNTRDDVLYSNGYKPWRRAPFWLFLRVVLQTSLYQSDEKWPNIRYKSFMLFFMSHILRATTQITFSDEKRFIMTSKIAHRASKLDPIAIREPNWLGSTTLTSVKESVAQSIDKWNYLQRNSSQSKMQQKWFTPKPSFSNDTRLRVPKLASYLKWIKERRTAESTEGPVSLRCHPRLSHRQNLFGKFDFGSFFKMDDISLCLVDFENWVKNSYGDWLTKVMDEEDACGGIATRIKDYHSKARVVYTGLPGQFSIMILTILELWAGLDRCATHQCPLLVQYDPEIDPSLFEPLLLPKRSQVERLLRVEQYLGHRKAKIPKSKPSIFHSLNAPQSFAVQYYDQSSHHQELRLRIESTAEQERLGKLAELQTKKEEYDQMIELARRLHCTRLPERKGDKVSIGHPRSCEKCKLLKEAQNLEIAVHEWPLPAEDLAAKAAVFELDIPPVVSSWRDSTFEIRVGLLSSDLPNDVPDMTDKGKSSVFALRDFGFLKAFASKDPGRLQIASVKRAFGKTHYSPQKVSESTQTSICVNHGHSYRLFDFERRFWTENFGTPSGIRSICTFELPPGPYQQMQYALDNTTHTSNLVIATQTGYTGSLSPHETYSFGTLRSGNRLQWLNILREIASDELDFNCEEVFLLIAQSAWQVGKSSNNSLHRESHIDLQAEDFGLSLLSAIKQALDDVQRNWQSVTMVRTYTLIVLRLLSLSVCEIIQNACISCLKSIRFVCLRWLRELQQKYRTMQSTGEAADLKERLLEVALTCHGSFDIDENFAPFTLESSVDLEVFIECSIVLYNYSPSELISLSTSIQSLLQISLRLSHRLESTLRQCILDQPICLDQAISRQFPDFNRATPWTVLPSPDERWIECSTANSTDNLPSKIHYNILSGSLLINRSHLVRLPSSYESHKSFRRLFGAGRVLDVAPSADPSMDYVARETFFDHRIYFAFVDSELVIRAKRGVEIFELIPIDVLEAEIPHAMVHDYFHWFNISTQTLEWRPLKEPWSSTNYDWRLKYRESGPNFLSKGLVKLVDVHTQTAKAIGHILQPLEDLIHIQIILNNDSGDLEVELPRLKLGFALKASTLRLESKQFQEMIVDEDQSFGTMTGLETKLVLCGKDHPSRMVIIPEGDIKYGMVDDQVYVRVPRIGLSHIPYHTFTIDSRLGRLVVDSGSLKGHLYKCYLHALTSHFLTDQLTGRTGTEEALSILSSAMALSFLSLEKDEILILELIGKLTPSRNYTPCNLKVMQTTSWSKLPQLSQHCSFITLVESIFRQARVMDILHDQEMKLPGSNFRGSPELLERAGIRNSMFCVDQYGAELYTTTKDEEYDPRDNASHCQREYQVYHVSRLVETWSTNLKCCSNLLQVLKKWKMPLQAGEVETFWPLGYHEKWLDPPEESLANIFGSLLKKLSSSDPEKDKYSIMTFLGTLSYSVNANDELIQTLLAFATVQGLRSTRTPRSNSFNLSKGAEPDEQILTKSIQKQIIPYRQYDKNKSSRSASQMNGENGNSPMESYRAGVHRCLADLTKSLMSQWPTSDPKAPADPELSEFIRLNSAMEEAQELFQSWWDNWTYEKYVARVQKHLKKLQVTATKPVYYTYSEIRQLSAEYSGHIKMDNLFKTQPPTFFMYPPTNFSTSTTQHSRISVESNPLGTWLTSPLPSSSGYEKEFYSALVKSYEILQDSKTATFKEGQEHREVLKSKLEDNLEHWKDAYTSTYHGICNHLQKVKVRHNKLSKCANLWPRLTPVSLLANLAKDKFERLSEDWKECLVNFGMTLSSLQRAEKLLSLLDSPAELLSEFNNQDHAEWSIMKYPEWLLLEIESGMTIRPMQAKLAKQMISPPTGANSLFQLNMGEGKSSVIVPIVAATIADKAKLARVVVLKPLFRQMFQLLRAKLGSLLNRRVYQLPFSRLVQLDAQKAKQIQSICEECMLAGGILLVQPEHVLSFELMGVEKLIAGEIELGNTLLRTKHWLDQNASDVLDESDEILNTQFELVYTMGTQRLTEFSPDRWQIIQSLLGYVGDCAISLQQQLSQGNNGQQGLYVSHGQGRVPQIRTSHLNITESLLKMVVDEISQKGLPGLPTRNFSPSLRPLISKYLISREVSESDLAVVERDLFINSTIKSSLLLVRGIIAGGVLSFVLQRQRWRVNYGLDLSRTSLAVPYNAKDDPSPRAEFSHPDTSIVLTCFCYYYGGLSDENLFQAFGLLAQTDRPQDEYDQWIQYTPNLPFDYRKFSNINLANKAHCSKSVFPLLKFAKGPIDFFLSNLVFPKEMREYPSKLSTSGWDIARVKNHPIVGFSGTNDSRYLLPRSIEQCDVPFQAHINAAVIETLLHPSNSYQTTSTIEDTLCIESLLRIANSEELPVRVILDVGAQVLEMSNQEFAKTWLERAPSPEIQAVIFFDEQNDLTVLCRDNTIEPLSTSAFSRQLNRCIIYLDEAHTRGTDLRLPTDYRALVTLGPGLAKDRLVQACMRMRKLGKGQSILFVAAREVEQRIREVNSISSETPVEVLDIVKWSIVETCEYTIRNMSFWALQGIQFQRRNIVWSKHLSMNGQKKIFSAKKAALLLESEAQSLESQYDFSTAHQDDQIVLQGFNDAFLRERADEIQQIRSHWQDFGVTSWSHSNFNQEQERELAPESEKERQVERNSILYPRDHELREDLRLFVLKGILRRNSTAFLPAMNQFIKTTAAPLMEVGGWSNNLLITADFASTVKVADNQLVDGHLRPVHWILRGRKVRFSDCIVLSPFEAQELLPSIRQSEFVSLHIYSSRLNRGLCHKGELLFHTIPAGLPDWTSPDFSVQIFLFAGQVNIHSYENYLAICRFLGLAFKANSDNVEMAIDGFVPPASRAQYDDKMALECGFSSSPVAFLRILMSLRRKGQNFEKSHIGRLIRGELLQLGPSEDGGEDPMDEASD